jgi:hypothetical protein
LVGLVDKPPHSMTTLKTRINRRSTSFIQQKGVFFCVPADAHFGRWFRQYETEFQMPNLITHNEVISVKNKKGV